MAAVARRWPWPRRRPLRRRATWAPLAALAAVGAVGVWAAVGAAVAGLDGANGHPLLRHGQSLAARAAVGPRDALFGDPIEAHLRVAVDPGQVDVGSLALVTDAGPYRIVRRERRSQHIGGDVVIDERLRLQCTGSACLAFGGRRPVSLPPALVRYRLRGGGARQAVVAWPGLAVGSRLTASDVRHAAFDLAAPLLPAPPERVDPGTLALLLLAGAALAGLAGTALLVMAIVPGRRLVTVAPALAVASAGPLRQALACVEPLAGRRRPGPDGSWALERLARVLDDAGVPALGARARAMAWSAEMLPVGALTALVDDCAEAARERGE
jgi:hypothetical protein